GWCDSISLGRSPSPASSRSPASCPSWAPSSVTGSSSGSSPASPSPSPRRSPSSARPSTTSTTAWPTSVRKSARGASCTRASRSRSGPTSAAAGTLVIDGTQLECGNAVIAVHGQETKSLYSHLSQFAVQPGQKVERGALLAYSGNTGRSSGPHLHYEILVKGRAVNPRAYLWD